ncbi:MAG: TatD family nuclease-associated radical SAM protein [Acidiferrobacter sp.]
MRNRYLVTMSMRVMPITTATKPPPVLSYRVRDTLYLNITSRCSLRCRFCPKFHKLWTVDGHYLRLPTDQEPSVSQLIAAARTVTAGQEVVFCGLGEPTTRLYVALEIAAALKRRGARVRLNTDGLANLLHGYDVTPDLEGLIDHVSISLNAHDEATYLYHCRPTLPGSFAALRDFAVKACEFVPMVTLTAIAGLAGVDIDACATIAADHGVHFRARPLESVNGRSFRLR